MKFLVTRITLLFALSFVFLWLHILDDAFITNEPSWYDIPVAEFLLACALVYGIAPPLGVWLTRRGSVVGVLLVTGYAFQALYGGGLNHVRHIFGDFRGSQLLPTLLAAVGVQVAEIRGQGFVTVLLGMLGLGVTPPHEHILASTVVAFVNIALNAALLGLCALALYAWLHARRATRASVGVTKHPAGD